MFEFPDRKGAFRGEKRLFQGQKWLFSARFADFLKGHFSSCGKTIANLRTFVFCPETSFCPAMTRGFVFFRPEFCSSSELICTVLKIKIGGWGDYLFGKQLVRD
jgi:hypothetical protein